MNTSRPDDDLSLYLVAQDLLGRYCHGVDHGDLDLAVGAFWPDATDHHGDVWHGNARDYMRDMASRLQLARSAGPIAIGPGFQHHVTTILVRRTGPDDAKVQAAFQAYVPYVEDGDSRVGLIVGRFLDHIQRRGDVWKVLSRVVVNDFTDGRVARTPLRSGSWQDGGYVAGGYGSTDPGVAFFGDGAR